MGNLLLTGAAGTARAACAAAVAAVALCGCETPPDYVKPTATTANAAPAPETPSGQAVGGSEQIEPPHQ